MEGRKLILLAALTSLLIYLLGFLTGYFVQVRVLSKAEREMESIREEFEAYRENLENIQLEQLYLLTYKGELSCKILVSILEEMQEKFSYFWSKLPPRLEAYEMYGELKPEYLELKRDYVLLSIRAWLLSLSVKERCAYDIAPALYFYSGDCERCVEQGRVLDELKAERPEFSAFLVDYNLDEPIVNIIKRTFNVTQVPSFVVNSHVYGGFQDLESMRGIISG